VAPVTSSAPERKRIRTPLSRLPIRLRVAVSVGAVTFVVLLAFAVAVGTLTTHRLRSNFDGQVTSQANNLSATLAPAVQFNFARRHIYTPDLTAYVSTVGGAARIFTLDGTPEGHSLGAPYLGFPLAPVQQINGYRVVTLPVQTSQDSNVLLLQYGLPVASLDAEIAQLTLRLILGVLAGTMLAFLAGSVVATRAIRPIAEITEAAAEIERTGDPTRTLPMPRADDEVAELSRTLGTMLASLSESRGRTEAALERQRAFVADASHELRTPLTSVLANLELLADSLRGQDRDIARSALRSTQRMRRLVADLLLLARSDIKQPAPTAQVDLADLVIAAASELEPTSDDHQLELRVRPTALLGSADDLQRIAINLIENAIRHTPPGTRVTASTRPLRNGQVELVVADDGPGIAPDLKQHLFDRFARGAGESSGSFGLGLAIVHAVTQAHGGTVEVKSTPGKGARFIVRLPGHGVEPAIEATTPAASLSA
jgi:two-component system OmpR family sensor kinase